MSRDEDAYIAGLVAGWDCRPNAGRSDMENDDSVLALAAAAPTWYYLNAHGPYASLEAEAAALFAFSEGFKYAIRKLQGVHINVPYATSGLN